MIPSKENGKKIFKCKCGASKIFTENRSNAYKIHTEIKHSYREVISNTKDIVKWKDENLKSSIKDFKCRSCGYDKAQLETRQTRSADEGMTI